MRSRWMVLGVAVIGAGLGVGVGGCGGAPPPATLRLDRVVLFQNGIGYFERHGEVVGEAVRMMFAPHELDDVLKTVTVIDANAASVANVEVEEPGKAAKQVPVTIRLSTAGQHQLHVSYAVPTPTWKASYRVVLDEDRTKAGGLLQGWATINNTSGEDWKGVHLALATGAPFSYAMDLKSPVYVSRPDVNGVMVAPVTAPVEAEVARGGSGDTDGDAVKDRDDLCFEQAEDRDGYEDEDGCPDLDNDRDRISDREDKCPNEPETYNGLEDEDGCPDRGRVVVTDTAIEILDHVFFKKGSAAIDPAQLPIVDALAQTLLGNPSITLVEIQGHVSDDEGSWELSMSRSASIVVALRQRGVESRRLTPQGYGATQPLDPSVTERARAKNRRVSFLILKRDDGKAAAAPAKAGAITTASVARSAQADTTAVMIAGASRFEIGKPMTIPRGGATMISIVNQTIDAEDIYLFRPDGKARGSDQHPFRAVRLHNSTKFTLQPGALAVFARRTYVGDSLLSALAPAATTFAPYALDEGTAVAVERKFDELPLRIVSAGRGSITLEVANRQLTQYTIEPAEAPPARIFLQHAKTLFHQVENVPPGSVDQGDSWLLAVPLAGPKRSTIVVEERAKQTRTYDLMASQLPDLTAYLAGSAIPDIAATAVRAAIAQRAELLKADEELDALRGRYSDQLERATEARASLAALGNSPEGAGLRKKLVADLAAVTTAMNGISRDLAEKTRAKVAVETKLRELVRELVIGEQTPAKK